MGIQLLPGLSALFVHNGRNQVAQPLAVDLGFKPHGHAFLLQGFEKALCAVDFVALLGRDSSRQWWVSQKSASGSYQHGR